MRLSAFLFITGLPLAAWSSSIETRVVTLQDPQLYKIQLQTSGVFFQNDDEDLTGVHIGAQLIRSVDTEYAVTAGFNQAFSSDNFSTLYSSIHVGALYSPSGLLQKERQYIGVGLDQMASQLEKVRSGWIYGATLNQYFFNGTQNVFPLVGPELSIQYQMATEADWVNQFGISFNYLRNGDESALGVRINWNVLYWL